MKDNEQSCGLRTGPDSARSDRWGLVPPKWAYTFSASILFREDLYAPTHYHQRRSLGSLLLKGQW